MARFWLRRLFTRKTRPVVRSTSAKPNRQRLALEGLEGREVPAFIAPVTYSAGANPGGIAVGDFNADGRDDMAVANLAAPGTVTVMLSNPAGGFLPGVAYPTGASPIDAAAGDLNGDGKLDLVTAGSGGVSVLLGNGDGTFGAATTYPAAGPHSVKLGDFNNDGKLDVGTVSGAFGVAGGLASVFLGNGDGTLQPRIDTSLPGDNINLVLGDYNHDGNDEIGRAHV